MSEKLYTTTATSTGGGRDGNVRTDDETLSLEVRPPKELGGSGEGTNPEQLVAAGWAACFNGALQLVCKNEGHELTENPEVSVTCTLAKDPADGGFRIQAEIVATVPGADDALAEELVKKADQVCPYSKAFRGDIDFTVTARS